MQIGSFSIHYPEPFLEQGLVIICCKVQGKVWTDGAKEPGEWMIALDADAAPPAGQASVWGQPYAGTPIGFDDLAVKPVEK